MLMKMQGWPYSWRAQKIKLLEGAENKAWSSKREDIADIANVSSYNSDMNGKSNTQAWVNQYGNENVNNAAGYCYNYATSGTGKGQWYLPAGGELAAILQTNRGLVTSGLTVAKGKALASANHWSSSENSSTKAWQVGTSSGSSVDKTQKAYVRCVLHFEDQGSGNAESCGAEYKYSCTGSAYWQVSELCLR